MKKLNRKTLSVIADEDGKGFGATDHTSPSGCQIHQLLQKPKISMKYQTFPKNIK